MPDPNPPRPPDTDLNRLFRVLALQLELIDARQFADACAGWAAAKDAPLADLLVARGWITPGDREDVERLLQRKLKKHGGDPRAGLEAAADPAARQALGKVDDPDVRPALDGLPCPSEAALPSTELYVPRWRYSLTRLHKEGGLGRVWLARDGDLNREVALKVIRPEKAGLSQVRRRFLREA